MSNKTKPASMSHVGIDAHDQIYARVTDNLIQPFDQSQFVGMLARWLKSMPMEQRQMIIDELTARTLRTLEEHP